MSNALETALATYRNTDEGMVAYVIETETGYSAILRDAEAEMTVTVVKYPGRLPSTLALVKARAEAMVSGEGGAVSAPV
jgi:hypothetical protein